MADNGKQGHSYSVHASGAIVGSIRRLMRRAGQEGRGQKVLAALTEIYQQLQRDPHKLGEPFYLLTALRLEIRTCVIRPVSVDYAIHLDKPLVFIKSVKLLTDVDG